VKRHREKGVSWFSWFNYPFDVRGVRVAETRVREVLKRLGASGYENM